MGRVPWLRAGTAGGFLMRQILSPRHPEVESLIRGLPSVGSDDWDSVRPWVRKMLRARNDWSVKNYKNRPCNSLGRKSQ